MITANEAFSRQAKVFSQNGEDGVLLYLLSKLSLPRYSLEIGASLVNGSLECNTRILLENGWSGEILDTEPLVHTFCKQTTVTLANVNILYESFRHNWGHFPSVFSLDIDGNDYWIWKKLEYAPRIVVIEYNAALDASASLVQPYSDSKAWGNHDYFGASAKAMLRLAHSKGYKLVTSVHHLNLFFVLDSLLDKNFQEPDLTDCCGIRRHNTHPNPKYIEV